MDIYVVQPGDNINTIADKYGVTVTQLIRDNGIENPFDLVAGQCIVIAYPKQTYTVQEGDTLRSIAEKYGVPLMQLYRNNPNLTVEEHIFPGQNIVISYNTKGKIATSGFTYAYINKDTLLKTLPSLTELSVFNYRSLADGEIVAYYDDTELIQLAKSYGVAPLMMTTTLTPQGEPNLEAAMSILSNEENQTRYINNLYNIVKTKGYSGANIIFNFLNAANQKLYLDFLSRVSERLKPEGYRIVATINYSIINVNNEITFEHIDYATMSQSVDNIIFLHLTWGTNNGPPSPVISLNMVKIYLDYLLSQVSPEKIIFGAPLIGYDWRLPYIAGKSSAPALTLNSALRLAKDNDAVIQFDEISQTPFFDYNEYSFEGSIAHIVWSIDARTIDSLNKMIIDNRLSGIGIWNIMIYYPQVWLLFYSQYEIQKLIPDSIS